jgi:SpoVK/Ycf46/Vps4 family AAA+-type ATPase
LVRAGAAGDKRLLKSAAEALVAEERAKKHHTLADRLQRALATVQVSAPAVLPSEPTSSGREAILDVQPRVQLDDLILPLPVREGGRQLIQEHIRADLLRAHGHEPRHRVLLSGPPGNGKTSYAEAIAEALSLPLFVIRYDALIGSYLGETNTRLRRMFDYVRTQSCVLFFDEFDSIGKERGDTHETGEIKRVVSFLLMQIDQLPSYVVTIAATNHAELLDKAVWRRFQMRLFFPAPDIKCRISFLERAISVWPEVPAMTSSSIAAKLGPLSYAELSDFCQDVRRRYILGLGDLRIGDALDAEIALWSSRVRPGNLDAERPRKTVTASTRPARGAASNRKRTKSSKA